MCIGVNFSLKIESMKVARIEEKCSILLNLLYLVLPHLIEDDHDLIEDMIIEDMMKMISLKQNHSTVFV